jgi:hypothetical protein
LWEAYEPDVYHRTIKSLEDDEIMQHYQTMVCLRIARVVPDESDDRRQEMCLIQVTRNDRHGIGVYCTRNEWKQLQQSSEHAKV